MDTIGSVFSLTLLTLSIFFIHTASGVELNNENQTSTIQGVFIPENEYIAYFDANGVYTVVGAIKNSEEFPVIPTVTINIQEDNKILSKSFEYVPIMALKDLPFKIKFPEVETKTPILLNPEVSFVSTEKNQLQVEVIYDKTLVRHEDGHLTGRIINNGNSTAYNIKVFALIHGNEQVLDMGQNFEMIKKMEPREIRNFSMYPDPSINDEIIYYSCFAPTDSTIVPMTTTRNEEKFFFRYDSGSWYYGAKFNEEGTDLSMNTYFSFQLPTYANFEIPYYTDNEKFQVFLNGEAKKSIQSMDEMGNWHVAFIVEPRELGKIVIKGFEPGWHPDKTLIPKWITSNAKLWSEDQFYQYDFVRGINFMISEEIIDVPVSDFQGSLIATIPNWLSGPAGWWADGLISDDDFINLIENLIKRQIIKIPGVQFSEQSQETEFKTDDKTKSLEIKIEGEKQVRRGTTHTLEIQVLRSDIPIDGAQVFLDIEDYGENIIKEFKGYTNSQGFFIFSWEIPQSFDDIETLFAIVDVTDGVSSKTELFKFQVYCLPGEENCKVKGN